jgi:glucokinase
MTATRTVTPSSVVSTPAHRAALRMGVDVGGTSIKWVVLDGESVIRQGRRPTPGDHEAAVLGAIADLAATEPRVESVGVALPAVIDAKAGATLVAPNLPGEWHGLAVVEPLQDALGVPVVVCNDGRALTNAEWVLGAARGRRDAIVLALGTGVGGGIVSDGRIVGGRRGRAGELGHIPVEPTGERCGCGAVGCLETLAGARALVRGGRDAVRHGSAPLLAKAGTLSPEVIVEAARHGDAGALDVLIRAGTAIGRAFAALAVSLTPELFVVGGGLAPALDLMRPAIEAELQERTSLTGTSPIVPSALGLHGGAIGAALWKEVQ